MVFYRCSRCSPSLSTEKCDSMTGDQFLSFGFPSITNWSSLLLKSTRLLPFLKISPHPKIKKGEGAKFPHNPILHHEDSSLLTENNDKNNTTKVRLHAFCVVFWW